MNKTLLFDLDGTLTDPKQGITKSVRYALEKFGITDADRDSLECFIGPPLIDSFSRYYSMSKAESEIAVEYYREYFSEKGIFENEIYKGIPEMLEALKSAGYLLAVATSKPTVFAEKILEHFHITDFFSDITGSNLDHTRSDKTSVIGFSMEKLSSDRDNTVMSGDRKFDIIGAKENNIMSVGVLYGYGPEEEIKQAQPDFTAETVIKLRELLLVIPDPM